MNQKIVITDGLTLNPGDLNWESFKQFGTIELHDRTPPSDVAAVCEDATVIVTNKTPINDNTINAARNLKIIAVTATGYNIVDTEAARRKGVVVCNVPGYGTDSVAQHTFALLLELTNHVGLNARSVAQGEWSSSPDFCYSKRPLIELAGKTIGIIGYGQIGQKTGEIAKAFGMDVKYFRPSLKNGATIEEIFSFSDVVSLHCPLTKDNKEFVNSKLLSLMKPSAFLINTARGQLINEADLAHALKNNIIAGAALDVLSSEPPSSDNPLIGAPNCLITPHTAWLSIEARKRIMDTTVDNITSALNGAPKNVVS